MAVIDGTELFYTSRSIRWWLQGIVVLLLIVRGRGEFSSVPTVGSTKCELSRLELRNRGLEAVVAGFPDNVTNGE